jgi:peptidoglycan lytic transglycosylase G
MKRRLFGLLPLLALAGTGWVTYNLYQPYRGSSSKVYLTIPPHTHSLEVATLLVQHGVLQYRVPFLLRHLLGKASGHNLEAGEYLFDRPLRPVDVYRKLVLGEVYLHTVVIPEGSDRFDMARIFQAQVGMDPQAFLQATANPTPICDLDPSAPTLEGYLFPDTYRFPRNPSVASVVATLLARFRHVINNNFQGQMQRDPQKLHATITLASLVEKETPDPAERPVIAGVFNRRLAINMPLQCDPTVLYAAKLREGFRSETMGPITQSELQEDSPYNTYRNPGIPPGPICSPGLASIRAALDPAPGKSLYFVSNLHGGHIFANSLAEHQRNVARYRQQIAAAPSHSANEESRPNKAPKHPRPARKTARHKKTGHASKQKTTHSGTGSHASTQ